MPPRIPTPEDFAPLAPGLEVSLAFPDPPESTTAVLVLLHGMGDTQAPFAGLARAMALPGVLGVAVRGTSPLPAALLGGGGDEAPRRHFHWGDDVRLDPATGGLDADPGFEGAAAAVLDGLVRGTLVGRCGWDVADVLLFGFGQGGSLALGLASRLRVGKGVKEEEEKEEEVGGVGVGGGDDGGGGGGRVFKGVVSIGGPLPRSMVPTVSGRDKARTPVLLCRGSESEMLDDEAVEEVRGEFADVRDVKWNRKEDGMPSSRDEMLPLMKFFAERLKSGW